MPIWRFFFFFLPILWSPLASNPGSISIRESCKCYDILPKKNSVKVIEALKNNEISTGHGLNQEMSLKRLGGTCWSSHYGAFVNLIHMFSSVINVIETIIEDALDSIQRAKENILIGLL